MEDIEVVTEGNVVLEGEVVIRLELLLTGDLLTAHPIQPIKLLNT